jgi:hypothetical protein
MFRVNQDNLMLADWLSTMPAAMDSRTDSSAESGKLFQSKVQVGMISQKFGMKIYERHKREKAQAYPLQAKITHAGYPREFKRIGGKENLVVNQPGRDQFNRAVIINNISLMPEMTVVLTPSTTGLNVRQELRTQYAELLQYLQDPKDRLTKLLFMKNIIGTQDMPEDEKEEMKKAFDLLLMSESMALTIQFKTLEAQYSKMAGPQQPEVEQGQEVSQGNFDQQKAIAATPQDQYSQVTQGATNG